MEIMSLQPSTSLWTIHAFFFQTSGSIFCSVKPVKDTTPSSFRPDKLPWTIYHEN